MKFFSFNILTLIALLLVTVHPASGYAANFAINDPPASYLLQVNGRIYRERGSGIRRPQASLTKVMTALLVLEHCRLDEVVTVNKAAASETGSRIHLHRGDRLTVHSLLAATLMASANDACRALAEHVGGSQPKFVSMMNRRAAELGLHDTQFRNACGHDQDGHYSTTHDLMVLANAALHHEAFAELVATPRMTITTVSGKRSYSFRNINRLIGRYDGAKGVKTGTTPKAGQCLIALAQRGETRVLLVIMRSRHRWQTAPAMLDAVFEAHAPKRPELIPKELPDESILKELDENGGNGPNEMIKEEDKTQ